MGSHQKFMKHGGAWRKVEGDLGGNRLEMLDPVSVSKGHPGSAYAQKSPLIFEEPLILGETLTLYETGVGLREKAEGPFVQNGLFAMDLGAAGLAKADMQGQSADVLLANVGIASGLGQYSGNMSEPFDESWGEIGRAFEVGFAEDLDSTDRFVGLLRVYADEKTSGSNWPGNNVNEPSEFITIVGEKDDQTFFLGIDYYYYLVDLRAGGDNNVIMNKGGFVHRILCGGGNDLVLIASGAEANFISLTRGGNNIIGIRDNSVVHTILGGAGNDSIDIRGNGARAELIDLGRGGNNEIYTEAWANILGGFGNDYIVSQPTFGNGDGIRADLSAGGHNTVILRGAASSVKLGAGNDTVQLTNRWDNGGHPGNWSTATIDLSLGGTNTVDVRGDTHTSGPTSAKIILGLGNSTIHAHEHTVVTILGANSTGNHNITLNGSVGQLGEVHTGHGHTSIYWRDGNYNFHIGSGDITFITGGDLRSAFYFDGSGRTANDVFVLNNWREGGEVRMGDGHTDVTLNFGNYIFQLGNGSASMSVNGHAGFSTINDDDGNLIVDRVDGQSSLAEAVHTFSAGESINLHYSLQLGHGIDKVQFYAGSGQYEITSSANRDIFQLDFLTGDTVGATYEVFDFKWGTDRILNGYDDSMDEIVFSDHSDIRFDYLGETADGHAFDLVAVGAVGNYEAGHVWMTVYSHDLPDLNFL